ncbi:hypothetical protein PUN28_001929 [Cardiocondyla obscurior]|uniref:Uncharacterized protein n=1 Tax=Cardiocondyla obscurior TaxID=286306 RepID=A0AAW2GRT1_9HYME
MLNGDPTTSPTIPIISTRSDIFKQENAREKNCYIIIFFFFLIIYPRVAIKNVKLYENSLPALLKHVKFYDTIGQYI